MKYNIICTDTADFGIRTTILNAARTFGTDAASERLDEIEEKILLLGNDPYMGSIPRYPILKRQGYRVLILKKDLIFYKINEAGKEVIIYAAADQRQDYLDIIRGL